MYSHQVGRLRLQELGDGMRAAPGFDEEQSAELLAEVEIHGLEAPEREDVQFLNAAISYFRIDAVGPDTITLATRTRRFVVDKGVARPRTQEESVMKAATMMRSFIVGFGVASHGIVVWRNFIFQPRARLRWLPASDEHFVNFEPRKLNVVGSAKLHLGYLFGAVEIASVLESRWPDRFFSLYEKGMTFLVWPSLGFDSFLDEAYVSFFRCMEFIVAQASERAGSFDEKSLVKAAKNLKLRKGDGLDEAELRELGRSFVRKRGAIAAHLGKKDHSKVLTPEDVFALKRFLDILIQASAKNRVAVPASSLA